MSKKDYRCAKCRKECKMFHAQHTDRGLCAFCNQRYTFLPDGNVATWEQYREYHRKEKEKRK